MRYTADGCGRMKQSFRLGGGEFEYKRDDVVIPRESSGSDLPEPPQIVLQLEQASIQEGRQVFLTAAGQVEPALLYSLSQRPLQAYVKSVKDPNLMIFDWRQVEVTRSFRELRTTVLEWSWRWKLTDRWCLEWIVQTLGWWRLRPSEPQKAWFHDDLTGKPFPAPLLRPKLRPWDPTSLTRADYEAQTMSIVERQLAIYCDDVEKRARVADLTRTPERRELEHFYWLARYQVKGEGPAEIAEGRDLGGCWSSTGSSCEEKAAITRDRAAKVEAVKKAITRLAKFIGLTPRSKLDSQKDSKPSPCQGT
jgi:hypothetical protein